MQRKTYKVTEAIAMLGVGKSTIYKLMNEGRLQRIKVGASTLITAASIDALITHDAG